MKPILLALLAFAIITGCATTDKLIYDSTPRPRSTNVQIYRDGAMPAGPFNKIAEFTYLGPREEELKGMKYCLEQAKKVGASGLLFEIVPAGQKGGFALGPNGGAGGFSSSWVFKGTAIEAR